MLTFQKYFITFICILSFSQLPLVHSELQEGIIDDQLGDLVTGLKPVYTPSDAWKLVLFFFSFDLTGLIRVVGSRRLFELPSAS
ncbi:hypothetical protein K435DRAFT_345136 [Dendrothele bispora CBS 962.96]|uniref:Uncharacterized protein n=1 Tax=Dendrothele bispora (strain CBS 962.96) TaxID=1314807 RepID=A0A4S8MJF1_DENBC|nr:hypothetical protein K435DRAFT_345136 [Dendrothele bispora CBS 962.96]